MATGRGVEGWKKWWYVVAICGLFSRNSVAFEPGTCSVQEGVQIWAAKNFKITPGQDNSPRRVYFEVQPASQLWSSWLAWMLKRRSRQNLR